MANQNPGERPAIPGEYAEVEVPSEIEISPPSHVTIEPRDGKLPPTSSAGNEWTWLHSQMGYARLSEQSHHFESRVD